MLMIDPTQSRVSASDRCYYSAAAPQTLAPRRQHIYGVAVELTSLSPCDPVSSSPTSSTSSCSSACAIGNALIALELSAHETTNGYRGDGVAHSHRVPLATAKQRVCSSYLVQVDALPSREDTHGDTQQMKAIASELQGEGPQAALFFHIRVPHGARITASEYSARVVHTTSASAIIQHLSALASRWGCHMAPTSSVDPLTLLLVARMRSARGRPAITRGYAR